MTRKKIRYLIWFGLAVPGLLMSANFLNGDVLAMDLLHPSGEMSIRLMVLALLPGPLAGLFGPTPFLRGWLAWRRNFGVAAFAYAMLHLAFYLIDMGALGPVLDEIAIPSIWTGWLALILMAGPAASSFDRAMVQLGRRRWKGVQRFAYGAGVFSILHWILLDWHWQPALVHTAPVIAVWIALGLRRARKVTSQ